MLDVVEDRQVPCEPETIAGFQGLEKENVMLLVGRCVDSNKALANPKITEKDKHVYGFLSDKFDKVFGKWKNGNVVTATTRHKKLFIMFVDAKALMGPYLDNENSFDPLRNQLINHYIREAKRHGMFIEFDNGEFRPMYQNH